ncbi:MAG: hypothetical protein AVDCRST_MAG36-2817, partial [uncultured Nocardioidaceae bacterium]
GPQDHPARRRRDGRGARLGPGLRLRQGCRRPRHAGSGAGRGPQGSGADRARRDTRAGAGRRQARAAARPVRAGPRRCPQHRRRARWRGGPGPALPQRADHRCQVRLLRRRGRAHDARRDDRDLGDLVRHRPGGRFRHPRYRGRPVRQRLGRPGRRGGRPPAAAVGPGRRRRADHRHHRDHDDRRGHPDHRGAPEDALHVGGLAGRRGARALRLHPRRPLLRAAQPELEGRARSRRHRGQPVRGGFL